MTEVGNRGSTRKTSGAGVPRRLRTDALSDGSVSVDCAVKNRTVPLFSNCLFGLVYLLLRGKAAKVVVARGESRVFPWHAGVLTRKRHFLSFKRLLPHAQNRFAPFWFLGSYQGLRRSVWKRVIGHGRIHQFPAGVALFLLLLGYAALFVPWVVAWASYGPIFTIRWAIQGLCKRKW